MLKQHVDPVEVAYLRHLLPAREWKAKLGSAIEGRESEPGERGVPTAGRREAAGRPTGTGPIPSPAMRKATFCHHCGAVAWAVREVVFVESPAGPRATLGPPVCRDCGLNPHEPVRAGRAPRGATPRARP